MRQDTARGACVAALRASAIDSQIQFREVAEGVLVAQSEAVSATQDTIALLKDRAAHTQKRRARLCAHRDESAAVHEMLIAVQGDSYLRPHLHRSKAESY